jgi:2-hydroxychromene-2-carboxylate isomerase
MTQTASMGATARIVVYGGFDSPWSYLASRRAALLAPTGVHVDWRAVEDTVDPPDQPSRSPFARTPFSRSSEELDRVRDQIEHVLVALLPGEVLPYSLAGFVPHTAAAVLSYAGAYEGGVAASVREMLFEAFWLHACDLGNPKLVHTLTTHALRGDAAVAALQRARPARDLSGRWAAERLTRGSGALPTLVVEGSADLCGQQAVAWLGRELVRRDVDLTDGVGTNVEASRR